MSFSLAPISAFYIPIIRGFYTAFAITMLVIAIVIVVVIVVSRVCACYDLRFDNSYKQITNKGYGTGGEELSIMDIFAFR